MEAMQEVKKKGFDRILLSYIDQDDNRNVKKAFNGTWLVFEEYDEAVNNPNILASVALTQKGRLLYFWQDKISFDGGYLIYDDFNEMKERAKEECIGQNIISAVASELGEDYVEFLDI